MAYKSCGTRVQPKYVNGISKNNNKIDEDDCSQHNDPCHSLTHCTGCIVLVVVYSCFQCTFTGDAAKISVLKVRKMSEITTDTLNNSLEKLSLTIAERIGAIQRAFDDCTSRINIVKRKSACHARHVSCEFSEWVGSSAHLGPRPPRAASQDSASDMKAALCVVQDSVNKIAIDPELKVK